MSNDEQNSTQYNQQGQHIEGDQHNAGRDQQHVSQQVYAGRDAKNVRVVTVGPGGTYNEAIYQQARTAPTDPETIAQACALFATLPTEAQPEPAPLPPGSRMLFGRTPTFVGREPDLLAIADALKGGQTTAISQAATIHGLGGIGKTTTATEFVHRWGQFFAGGVFWLSFADPANIPAEIAQCGGAGHMQLYTDAADLSLPDQVAAVQRAWAEELPRLLVFDNVDTDDAEALVQQYRPTTGGARVLITSRRGLWDAGLGITALPLGTLPREKSINLLRQFRANLSDADADAVAAELGDLPLALHLAGSFLALYDDLSAADYLAELHSEDILNHESLQGIDTTYSPTNHELHVGRTFAASYRRLKDSEPLDVLARALLARAAHFAPSEPIPRSLLLQTVDLPDKQAERQARRALHRLSALGLLEFDDDAPTLHRLLARFVQHSAADDAAQAAVEQAILKEMADSMADSVVSQEFLPLLPHLHHITDAALPRKDTQAAILANSLGYCLHTILANYPKAQPYHEQALAIFEQELGPEHPAIAISLNNLAGLLSSIGDYAAARPLLERALAITEKRLEPDHSGTAQSLNNLADLLKAQGDYAAARPLLERALAITEKVLGPRHPRTATSLNNLAGLLEAQGDYAAARPLYERALDIFEQVLGSDSLQTAKLLSNLANLLRKQSDYAAAQPLLERSLEIKEQVMVPYHPDTAHSLNNLALLHEDMGHRATAQLLYERALAIREQVLGPEHPHTALSLDSLAGLLKTHGEAAAARPLYKRALAIREQVLGPEHPDTAGSLNNLAGLLHNQGEYAAARPLYERALAICENVFGTDHPHTQVVRSNLERLIEKMGEPPAG
jgi:tetratricopeptide (TPR) repeat protein